MTEVRDWQKDMKSVEDFKYAQTLCNGIKQMFHGQTWMPEPVEIALEYWLQQAAVEKERADSVQEELNDLEHRYLYLEEHSLKQKFKLEEEKQRADIAELAYRGLTEDAVSRGEYESLLDKHTTMTRAYWAEKERADKAADTAAEWICKYNADANLFEKQKRELAAAEEREQKLIDIMHIIAFESDDGNTRKYASQMLATLYPDTPAPTKEVSE